MDFRTVAAGLKFPEGPLVLPNGDILLTEITQAGCLTRITPDGPESVFATTGGGPNGAALGPEVRCSLPQTAVLAGPNPPADGAAGLFR